jgi:hypothetical protein
MNPNAGPGDDAYGRDRNAAYLMVAKVVGILKDRLWDGVT